MKKSRLFKAIYFRRFSQIVFLLLFLILFRKTEYPGQEIIDYPVNLFFCWNPFIALSVMLITKTLFFIFLPALLIIGITIIFGRVFCSWICPMGSLLDIFQKCLPERHYQKTNFPEIKNHVLIVSLLSAFFGLQLAGYIDPFAILFRGLAFVVDPAINHSLTGFFDYLYLNAPEWLSGISEPVYQFLKHTFLPYQRTIFVSGIISFSILFLIIMLEIVERRFWCKKICPLGALLSFTSRFSFYNRLPKKLCTNCKNCEPHCRMNAFDDRGYHIDAHCSRCMACYHQCSQNIVRFSFRPLTQQGRHHMNISRRHFVGSTVIGAVLPFVHVVDAQHKIPQPYLLRPPGARKEKSFQDMCIRCGECMKVCITNALQPTFLETGWTGMFVPKVIPRLGYCEFNCHLCGQVCPTGAIQELTIDQKHQTVIGKAVFDKNRCLPYAKKTPCIVCEEHCPVYNKAIQYKTLIVKGKNGKETAIKQPYVIEDRCIGCGICENKCPLPGEAAIRVRIA
jgi:polyferredoxin